MRKLSVIALAALLWSGAAAHAELVDRVVAVVNRDIITLSELEKRAAPELKRLSEERDPKVRAEQRAKVLEAALDALIGEKLMEAEVRELGLSVTNEEVEAAMADVRRQNSIQDAAQFERLLAEEGLTLAGYKDFLRKQLERMRLMQLKVGAKVKVTEEDLRAAYTQYVRMEQGDTEVRARHILVQVDEKAPPEKVDAARKKAQSLADEARKPGVDFAALARAKSEGTSAADGGDLGYFGRGMMVPAFERVAFSLKEGEVSEPVRTNFGWHVVKVEERRAVEVAPFEKVKDELEVKLKQQKMEKLAEQYVQELRQKASVEEKL